MTIFQQHLSKQNDLYVVTNAYGETVYVTESLRAARDYIDANFILLSE